MGVLSRIRGLWRFDGDVDPVGVSRRRFIFLTGVVAAGAAIPAALASEPISLVVSATTDGDGGITYNWTRATYPVIYTPDPMRSEYLRRLKKTTELYRWRQFQSGSVDGEWTLPPDHPIITGEFTG